jgi:hypothetical protein
LREPVFNGIVVRELDYGIDPWEVYDSNIGEGTPSARLNRLPCHASDTVGTWRS